MVIPFHAGEPSVDPDLTSLLAAMPPPAAAQLLEAWRTCALAGAGAAGRRLLLLNEIVADKGRDVALRWSDGIEQQLPLRLDMPQAVLCLASYLQSEGQGTATEL